MATRRTIVQEAVLRFNAVGYAETRLHYAIQVLDKIVQKLTPEEMEEYVRITEAAAQRELRSSGEIQTTSTEA